MPHLERLHRATKTAANYFQLKKICFSLEKSTLIKVNGLEEYIYIYFFVYVCVCQKATLNFFVVLSNQ